MDAFGRVTLSWGGGQPMEFDVSLSRHPDDGSPVVGLRAVAETAGDFFSTLEKQHQDQLKTEALQIAQERGWLDKI